jgi:hypothetical protein
MQTASLAALLESAAEIMSRKANDGAAHVHQVIR